MEQSATEGNVRRKDTVIERLGEQYQLYTFPRYEPETEGYDVAVGGAIIAEGLAGEGPMAEVIERLRIRRATGDVLHENTETMVNSCTLCLKRMGKVEYYQVLFRR
jgi:predicted butyrate kinase (DUF1464 family)